MGLLEQLAAAAIRNNVISSLRSNCPADLKDALEKLLADKEAVTAIQNLVMGAMKNPDRLSAEAVLALPYDEATAALLAETPALVEFLVQTAQAKIKR